MKTILIILTSLTLSLGASAQRKGFYHGTGTRVYVVPSFNYGLNYGLVYGYPYFGYPFYFNPYGYGYPYYGNSRGSYNLSLKIQSIKVGYRNKIQTTRNDKSISHAQRRQQIRTLKTEREQAIINAQRDYYNNRQKRMNYQNQGPNNNQQNQGGNNQNQGNGNNPSGTSF